MTACGKCKWMRRALFTCACVVESERVFDAYSGEIVPECDATGLFSLSQCPTCQGRNKGDCPDFEPAAVEDVK